MFCFERFFQAFQSCDLLWLNFLKFLTILAIIFPIFYYHITRSRQWFTLQQLWTVEANILLLLLYTCLLSQNANKIKTLCTGSFFIKKYHQLEGKLVVEKEVAVEGPARLVPAVKKRFKSTFFKEVNFPIPFQIN